MAPGFLLWISSLALILFLFSAAVAFQPAIPFAPSGQVPDDRMTDVRDKMGDGKAPGIGPAVVSVVNSARAWRWTNEFKGGIMPESENFAFRRLVGEQRVQEEGGVANHIDYRILVGYYSGLGTVPVRVHRLHEEIDGLDWNYVDSTP